MNVRNSSFKAEPQRSSSDRPVRDEVVVVTGLQPAEARGCQLSEPRKSVVSGDHMLAVNMDFRAERGHAVHGALVNDAVAATPSAGPFGNNGVMRPKRIGTPSGLEERNARGLRQPH